MLQENMLYECPLCGEKLPEKDKSSHEFFNCKVLLEVNGPLYSLPQERRSKKSSKETQKCMNGDPKYDLDSHKQSCNKPAITQCAYCEKMINVHSEERHLRYCEVLKRLKAINGGEKDFGNKGARPKPKKYSEIVKPKVGKCTFCKTILNDNIILMHEKECVHQLVECSDCSETVLLKDVESHDCKSCKGRGESKSQKSEDLDKMAKAMDDCKIQFLKTSNKAILYLCTLKVPNFFTLPEYDSSFEVNSSSFEIANATWCFKFHSAPYLKDYRAFAVSMKRMNSEIQLHSIIYKITLLDANNKKYAYGENIVDLEEDSKEIEMWSFRNDGPSYDTRDTLTLIIHLYIHGLTEQDIYKAPEIQDLHDKMAEEKKDCKISLKMSKESISSDVYTFTLSSLLTMKEHYGTDVKINSPTFEFANETWCFQFHFEIMKYFDVSILKLNSKNNDLNKNLNKKQKFFYLITLLDSNEKKYTYFGGDCYLEVEEIYKLKLLDTSSYDTLIIHLFPIELLNMDAENMLRPLEGDVDLLIRDLRELFMNGKNYDLTLRVAGKDFLVHRAILVARSAVFEAMLSHDMIEKNSGVIDVPDSDPQVMEQLLFYVYSGKVETLNQDNAIGLYYTSDKYNMMLLKDQCAEFLKKSLSPSTICDVIQLALNHNDTDLLECAKEYFVNHISKILPTVEWMSFMKVNSIAANELLIKATKKWDCDKL